MCKISFLRPIKLNAVHNLVLMVKLIADLATPSFKTQTRFSLTEKNTNESGCGDQQDIANTTIRDRIEKDLKLSMRMTA